MRWRALLEEIYGVEAADEVAGRFAAILDDFALDHPLPPEELSERDSWLITYPDQFRDGRRRPLEVLGEFLDVHTKGWMTGVHVLPFYPWSSDDGFSIVDYLEVASDYGRWDDIARLSLSRRLMVDVVVNHMSASAEWFQRFLADDPRFAGFFRTADPDADLSETVRPRTTSLLTRFGDRWVWTTFSEDQVDLDYANPEVLAAMLEVVLAYVRHGASVLRLDAVGFLWKEEGTSSIHHPKTHAIVQFFRACLDAVAPGTVLVTETNVPHEENVAYFGDARRPEAHLVYQFPLAPLVLDAVVRGDTSALAGWAAGLDTPVPGTAFLNFLASHDGVGLRPVEGLLDDGHVTALADLSRAVGGGVGERTLPGGNVVPYELNSTWFDLVGHGYDEDTAVRRHLATHAVMFALAGVPLVYVHSLFGSSNDRAAFRSTGRIRSLNRRKFDSLGDLTERLSDMATREARVFSGIREMIVARSQLPAFAPTAPQVVTAPAPGCVVIERGSGAGRAVVVVNLSDRAVGCGLPEGRWASVLGPHPSGGTIELDAWSSAWLSGV